MFVTVWEIAVLFSFIPKGSISYIHMIDVDYARKISLLLTIFAFLCILQITEFKIFWKMTLSRMKIIHFSWFFTML